MSEIKVVEDGLPLGMRRDQGRDQTPKGSAWWLSNFIPSDEAMLTRRGGWEHASADLSSLSATTFLRFGGWAPFHSNVHGDGPQLVVLGHGGSDTQVYRVEAPYGDSAGTYVGALAGVYPLGQPFWHRDRMILPTSGTVRQLTAAGGTFSLSVLGGSPPSDINVGASWGDYLLLANGLFGGSSYHPRRIWVSGVGTPEAGWNNTTAFFDMTDDVWGLVPIKNMILVFHRSSVWGLTGELPPPGGNWRRDYLFGEGLGDPRSLARYKDYVIWANANGVFKTDGTTITNLTEQAGISEYYRSLMNIFDPSSDHTLAGGVHHGKYWLTPSHQPAGLTLIFDLDNPITFTFGNVDAVGYVPRPVGGASADADELFFINSTYYRVGYLSSVWTPDSTNWEDADGTDVLGQYISRYYKLGSEGLKAIRRAYLDYRLEAVSGQADPTLRFYTYVDPHDDVGTLNAREFPKTATVKRRPLEIRRNAYGVQVGVFQNGPAKKFDIHSLSVESWPLEAGRAS